MCPDSLLRGSAKLLPSFVSPAYPVVARRPPGNPKDFISLNPAGPDADFLIAAVIFETDLLYETRRAAVEDLAQLRLLWDTAGLPGRELELRLNEFYVAVKDGYI